MGTFAKLLRERNRNPYGRRWLFVPYDQLNDGIGPLSREDPRSLGIVVVESQWKAARRPYHKQKLALVLANLRHFCLEQAERGVAVRHVVVNGPYRLALEPLVDELGPLRVMRPAERELRADLQPLMHAGKLVEIPHEGWLTKPEHFQHATKGPPWRMDVFYRFVRKATGILMERGKPIGGKFSFDDENRRPWPGTPTPPLPPSFPVNAIALEVAEIIESRMADHPGNVDLASLPTTKDDADAVWSWARSQSLPNFGPFEDAMSTQSSGLFHTRISGLLNLHRLLPARVVADALAMDLDLATIEGFVRQILGWREFVRHVHEATDGFRTLQQPLVEADDAARPNFFEANQPLPAAYWGKPSGLACLDRVVADVWREGYSHHITRLMVLSNIATLLDVSPRELTDWFWLAYIDAYDWVVEPNVLGMGTFAVGDLMTTKPYICGAAYIDRMSDYCRTCQFHPKRDCPIGHLYWAFLERHRNKLAGNQRLAMPLRSAAKRSTEQRENDAAVFEQTRATLAQGKRLAP